MRKMTSLYSFGLSSLLTNLAVTNSESCAITPINRLQMKNGQPLPCETESVGGHTTTSNGDQGLTMARMVDWCLGFVTSKEDRDVTLQAYASCLLDEDDCSLNQSRSFVKAWSLFVDFEIKKVLSLRDPLVQLAIWNSAAFIKKRRHGWDAGFPVPAIAVNGPSWDLYLFFEMNGDLVSYNERSSSWSFEAMLTIIDIDNDGSPIYGQYKRFEWLVADRTSPAYSC